MEQLCHEIGMPEEVTRQILAIHRQPGFMPKLEKLFCEATWDDGLMELRGYLGDDPKGLRMLCSMLRCGLTAWNRYQEMGISRKIYIDTMACFSRFVNEHLESYGCFGFDRDFWTVRQISCKLFRIGQLEYELTTREGVPVISLHIPSDAILERPLLRASYLQARELIGQIQEAYTDAPMRCSSWLLSPTLKELLPAQSRILDFQRSFSIIPCGSGESYKLWVFLDPRLTVDQFPENTSLQRRLKAFLLDGGSFVEAEGTLIQNPFV